MQDLTPAEIYAAQIHKIMVDGNNTAVGVHFKRDDDFDYVDTLEELKTRDAVYWSPVDGRLRCCTDDTYALEAVIDDCLVISKSLYSTGEKTFTKLSPKEKFSVTHNVNGRDYTYTIELVFEK